MTRTLTPSPTRQEIAKELLGQAVHGWPSDRFKPAVARRVSMLERQAPHAVEQAHRHGVSIEYLGIAPLFKKPLLHQGEFTDWTVGPADSPKDLVIPARERRALRQLDAIPEIDFSLLYIAHEIEKHKTQHLVSGRGPVELDRAKVDALVGPNPDPVQTVELNARMGKRSAEVLKATAQAGRAAGMVVVGAAAVTAAAAAAVVAAPFVVAAGALATLDPMIIGAVPALRAEVGQPAGLLHAGALGLVMLVYSRAAESRNCA